MDKFVITVIITRDNNQPVPVPGSVTHAAEFDIETDNHRLLQLSRDKAEMTMLAFLTHSSLGCTRCKGSDP